MTTRIALVTGSSRGLGRDMATALARDGFDVVITYREQRTEAAAVVAEIEALGRRAMALQLDVSASDTFAAFADTLGEALRGRWQAERVQVLVNNAGIGLTAPFAETTPEQFDTLYAIHLKGPYFLTQSLLGLIADGGRIINVSSGLARFSFPGYSAYAAMKGGVEVLTRYMARELGPRGIAVNTLAPGAIETDFGGGAVRDNPDLNAQLASNTALGRVGLPGDIGGVVAALASPAMGWVNAQRIEVSGGMLT